MSGQTVTCRDGSSQQGRQKGDTAKLVACRDQLFRSYHTQYKQNNGLLKITYRPVKFFMGGESHAELILCHHLHRGSHYSTAVDAERDGREHDISKMLSCSQAMPTTDGICPG